MESGGPGAAYRPRSSHGAETERTVINFISKDSIEERILDLLRFKKLLFAGALDGEGDDVIMVGPSQLERFMESVEAATENLPRSNLEQERRERLEDERERLEDAAFAREEGETPMDTTVVAPPSGTEALQNLLRSGAEFFMDLGNILSPSSGGGNGSRPENGRKSGFASLVQRDETTGENCLKIPLPNPEALSQLVSGMGSC